MLSSKKKVYKEEKPLNNENMIHEDSLKIVTAADSFIDEHYDSVEPIKK